jgi:hypothetical protein
MNRHFKINHPVPAILATLTVCFLLGLLGVGCSTTGAGGGGGGKVITPQRVKAVTKLGVYYTASREIAAHPEKRPAFERARAGLEALIAQENWDAEALSIALHQSGETFSGSEGELILTGAPLVLDAFSGDQWDLKDQELVRAAIEGSAEGLTLALGPRPRGREDPWLEKLTTAAQATRLR